MRAQQLLNLSLVLLRIANDLPSESRLFARGRRQIQIFFGSLLSKAEPHRRLLSHLMLLLRECMCIMLLVLVGHRHHFGQFRGWRLLLGHMIDRLVLILLRLLKSVFRIILVAQGHQLCHTFGLLHCPLEKSLIDHALLPIAHIWRIDYGWLQSAQII